MVFGNTFSPSTGNPKISEAFAFTWHLAPQEVTNVTLISPHCFIKSPPNRIEFRKDFFVTTSSTTSSHLCCWF